MNIGQVQHFLRGQQDIEWLLRQSNDTGSSAWVSTLRAANGQDITQRNYRDGIATSATLLVLHHHGEYTGETTISIHEGTTKEDLRNAIASAAKVNSARYVLAESCETEPEGYSQKLGREQAQEVLDKIHQRIDKDPNLRLAKATVDVREKDNRVTSSNWHDASFKISEAYAEVLLLYDADSVDSRFTMFECRAPDIEGLGIENALESAIEQLQNEQRMFPNYDGPVVLVGDAVRDFFTGGELTDSPFIYHSSAKDRYTLEKPMVLGTSLVASEIKGDPVTISSDPTPGLGLASSSISRYGAVPKRTVLFEGSRLVGLHANAQYARYLGVECTGGLGNIVVAQGQKSIDDMITPGCAVVTSWASFKADPTQGTINTKAQTGHMMKGAYKQFSTAGIVQMEYAKALCHITLSSQIQRKGNYVGPMAIRIEQARIIGE